MEFNWDSNSWYSFCPLFVNGARRPFSSGGDTILGNVVGCACIPLINNAPTLPLARCTRRGTTIPRVSMGILDPDIFDLGSHDLVTQAISSNICLSQLRRFVSHFSICRLGFRQVQYVGGPDTPMEVDSVLNTRTWIR